MTNPPQRQPLWLPRLAALACAAVGLINIASALTPDIRWRGHLLLGFEPVETIRLFHAMALPFGTALVLVAPYLLKRRRRALQAAIGIMLALGLFDLLKGLDFEETVITWGAAAVLYAGRGAFAVRHDPITLRSAVWRVPLLSIGALALVAVAAWVSAGHPSVATVVRETGDLLAWRHGPLSFEFHRAFDHRFAWIPLGVHMVEIATLLTVAYVIFRPLAAPRRPPDYAARQRAASLVREHGSDTLSYFKLRADKQYFFSDDQGAFVGYRIENGVLLLSGDPVGPRDALAPLLAQVAAFAELRGLKLGAVGASEGIRWLYERMGLHTLYLGDEAIVDLLKFSLQGRPIRKVRQSVTRLQKAGYDAELRDFETLDGGTVAAIEKVVELGRQGAPERGFSMAMDSINGQARSHTMVLIARDGEGAIRGVLHFVPCYGRDAVSLSFMRRDPDTPNGLTEFMVASAAELLRERGLVEMSLNFAAFAKWMHSPSGRLERTLGRIVALGNPFFQIESLYRFNAKFFPRWEPRYLVYQGTLGLARAGIAAMWAEGQLPKPSLPSRREPISPVA